MHHFKTTLLLLQALVECKNIIRATELNVCHLVLRKIGAMFQYNTNAKENDNRIAQKTLKKKLPPSPPPPFPFPKTKKKKKKKVARAGGRRDILLGYRSASVVFTDPCDYP